MAKLAGFTLIIVLMAHLHMTKNFKKRIFVDEEFIIFSF